MRRRTAFSKTDFRKARVATFGGGLRTSLPTSRRVRASPARAGLAVPSQPPSEPMTFLPETARKTKCVLRTAISEASEADEDALIVSGARRRRVQGRMLRTMIRRLLPLAVLFLASTVHAEFKAGAAVIDITPPKLPVLVNGGMLSRYVDKINTRVNARAIVATDGKNADRHRGGGQLHDEPRRAR
jgi:hypothetical protein